MYLCSSNKMAEFFSIGNLATYDPQAKGSFKAFEIAPCIERIVTTSADRPKMVGLTLILFITHYELLRSCPSCLLLWVLLALSHGYLTIADDNTCHCVDSRIEGHAFWRENVACPAKNSAT